MFERLKQHQLYLKWAKCDLYTDKVNCLGHIIDKEGIHVDTDKVAHIREWHTSRNYNDIQWFIGLVNYIRNFLPDITSYTSLLLVMTQNRVLFYWCPLHQRCFEMIKHICDKALVIQPIEPKMTEPIWLICDASKYGIGAMYGQGLAWKNCRPARFMSKKFTTAQQNYTVHILETLAILKALMKWEDKLIGCDIHIITNHKALEFFKTQLMLMACQHRWMDYLSRFTFDIMYIKGDLNKVANCLSQYYKSNTIQDIHQYDKYVQADVRIDPAGEDFPAQQYKEMTEQVIEIRAMREDEHRHSTCLHERKEQ